MKKSLLVFCVALTITSLSAQHCFPKDSAEWKVWRRNTGVPSSSELRTYSYSSDTVISNLNYQQLIFEGGPERPFLRNDSVDQRVYFRLDPNWGWGAFTDSIDYLLYDFSKSLGDTIKIENYWQDTVKWYVVKDSFMTIGSQQRRFIDVRRGYFGYQQTDRWIEGLGSIHGLFAPIDEPPGFFERHFELICFQNKGTSFRYEPHPQYDCNTPKQVFSVEETDLRKIKSYPNPFEDKLHIENGSDAVLRFSLLSPTGAECIAGSLGPHQNTLIETQHLPQGVYLIRYFLEEQSISQKLIKK